jgi:hypothetical protein
MKIPVENFTKMLSVGAALMHADKQTGRRDEANKRTSPFMRKRLKNPKMCRFKLPNNDSVIRKCVPYLKFKIMNKPW